MAMLPQLTKDEAKVLRDVREKCFTDHEPRDLNAMARRGLITVRVGGVGIESTVFGLEALALYDREHAKSERHGWVSARERGVNAGEFIKTPGSTPWMTSCAYHQGTFVPEALVWTGCPTCEREEPHEPTECGARFKRNDRVRSSDFASVGVVQDTLADARDGIDTYVRFGEYAYWVRSATLTKVVEPLDTSKMSDEEIDREFGRGSCMGETAKALNRKPPPGPFMISIGKGGGGGSARSVEEMHTRDAQRFADLSDTMNKLDEAIQKNAGQDERPIESEDALARAMFVAKLWDEIAARAELDDPVFGVPKMGDTEHEAEMRRVAAIAWDDPEYAKHREWATQLAERVWNARSVGITD